MKHKNDTNVSTLFPVGTRVREVVETYPQASSRGSLVGTVVAHGSVREEREEWTRIAVSYGGALTWNYFASELEVVNV